MKRTVKTAKLKNIIKPAKAYEVTHVIDPEKPTFPEPTKEELDEIAFLKRQSEIVDIENKRDEIIKHELNKNPEKRNKKVLEVLNADKGDIDGYSSNNVENFIEVPPDPEIVDVLRDPEVYYKRIRVQDELRTYYYYFPIHPVLIPNSTERGYKFDNYDAYLDSSGSIIPSKSKENSLPMLLFEVSRGNIDKQNVLNLLIRAGMFNPDTGVFDFSVRGKSFRVLKSIKEKEKNLKAEVSKQIKSTVNVVSPEDIIKSETVEKVMELQQPRKIVNSFLNGFTPILGLSKDDKIFGKDLEIENVFPSNNSDNAYVILKKGDGERKLKMNIVGTIKAIKNNLSNLGLDVKDRNAITNKSDGATTFAIIEKHNKKVFKEYMDSESK